MVKLYGGGLRLKHVQTSEIFEFVNIWLIDMPYYCTKTHFVFFADFSFFLSLIGGLGSSIPTCLSAKDSDYVLIGSARNHLLKTRK